MRRYRGERAVSSEPSWLGNGRTFTSCQGQQPFANDLMRHTIRVGASLVDHRLKTGDFVGIVVPTAKYSPLLRRNTPPREYWSQQVVTGRLA